jgi:hypothetical protein
MAARETQLASGRALGAQLVGHKLVWSEALLLQQLPHKPQGSRCIPLGLDQQVQHLALTVDSPSQVHGACPGLRPPFRPSATCPSVSAAAGAGCGRSWAQTSEPSDGQTRRHLNPALRQELLDIAVAQREPKVEPYSVPDDLGWELMAGIGDGLHGAGLPRTVPGRPPCRDNAPRTSSRQFRPS